MRAKFKNGDELEYVDETGATVKLSEDDIYEINAIPSFRAYMQNELGPRLQFSLDITKYSHEDFLRYLEGTYDPENPDKYVTQAEWDPYKHRYNTGPMSV